MGEIAKQAEKPGADFEALMQSISEAQKVPQDLSNITDMESLMESVQFVDLFSDYPNELSQTLTETVCLGQVDHGWLIVIICCSIFIGIPCLIICIGKGINPRWCY